jgi:hypothetical protein
MQALLATQPAFPTPSLVFAPLAIGGGLAMASVAIIIRGGWTWDYRADRPLITGCCVAIGVFLLVAAYGVLRWRRFVRAPATAVPAIALSKRSVTWKRTTFRMTFWFEGRGESEEVIDVTTFGEVLAGDAGAAWFREGRFVGFRKLAASPRSSD